MSLRLIWRAVALGFALGGCIVRSWLMRMGGKWTPERRALWLQKCCKSILRSMDVACDVQGQIPAHGLVVSNHLSYLDIVVLSAAMPCFFVSKAEVKGWPFFGWAARRGGTIFIDRSSLASAEKVALKISERLPLRIPILLFPEGTSTDGTMRRFHTRLFEPVVRAGAVTTAASIRYRTENGTPESELCWYGDDAFAPHLLKTLKQPGIHAELHFGEPHTYPDRRVAAEKTFREIAAMRGGTGKQTRADTLQPA